MRGHQPKPEATATIRLFEPGESRPARCNHSPSRHGSCQHQPAYRTTLTHRVWKTGHQPYDKIRETNACTSHAEAFADKYGLDLTAVVEAVAA